VAADIESRLGADPLREPLWVLLARAHAAAGDQAAALEALRRAKQVLADELGVDPGPELQQVQAQVLAQDPALLPAHRRLPPGLAGPTAAPSPAARGNWPGSMPFGQDATWASGRCGSSDRPAPAGGGWPRSSPTGSLPPASRSGSTRHSLRRPAC
jgi:hypothetical protein